MAKPTMKSIAEDLGVSRSAVSFVLNGDAEKRRINPETARRIRERAAELDFKPNFFARALNTRRSGAVGLVFPDIHEAYMTQLVRGVDEVFAERDAQMMLCSSRMDPALELRNVRSLLHRGVDGLILIPCARLGGPGNAAEPPLAGVLRGAGVPVVCADRVPAYWEWDAVVQDDRESARDAVAKLASLGAKRIACVSFDLGASSTLNRVAGYRESRDALGLPPDERLLVLLDRIDPQSDDLSSAMARLLALPSRERPDAWFVTTQGLSYRVRELLRLLGDHADAVAPVARFGADPEFFSSDLIGIAQPHRSIGRRAAELLLSRLDDPRRPPVRDVIPTTRLF